MVSTFKNILFWLLAAGLAGCSGLKFIPEKQHLYTGAKLKFETNSNIPQQGDLEDEMEAAIRPKPNKRYLGIRPGVWFYYAFGNPEKKKGLGNWVRKKLGRKPVLLSDATPDRTAQNLRNILLNNGYFQATVVPAVEKKEKTASITYTASMTTPPYRIREISFKSVDSAYRELTPRISGETKLQTGEPYRLKDLEAEMKRVEKLVKDNGYYYFDSRYLIFKADTTVGERQVDLFMGFEAGMPAQTQTIYRINRVVVVNDYTMSRDSTVSKFDTTVVGNYRYLYRRDNFRPEIILNSVNLRKDSIYRRSDHELTLSRLTDLKVFKFVNVRFNPQQGKDSLLNVHIVLTPLLRKSLRLEAQATSKSNNFVGPSLTGTFTNRNAFRGAELLQFRLNTGYEVQINPRGAPINSFEVGAEASLTIPRFISPIRIPYQSHRYMPQTVIKLGFQLQQRQSFFRLNSFSAAYGYAWRETATKSHQFYPADAVFFQVGNISDQFQQRLDNDRFLRSSLQDQFILGSRYSFTYNSQLAEGEKKPDNLYFNANVEVSGNLAALTQRTLRGDKEGTRPYDILGSPYSQYTRTDVDVRYYHDFDKNNQFATRLIAGAGFAYGNSFTMPFIKQFSAGGSNSLRAFRARSVGPGTYFEPRSRESLFIDQTADIKLEYSAEYRFGIIGFLKGAVFADAGNVWLLRNDDSRPGAAFQFKSFLNQLAVGTGVGLRLDAQFFVLRLDAAFPVRRPYLPAGERWVLDGINFRSRDWRRENLILNVAIGYPF